MRTFLSLAAVAAALAAAPAFAQDAYPAPVDPAPVAAEPVSDAPTAPDGTRAFGLDPYVAIMGGYEQFDRRGGNGIPRVAPGNNRLDGGLVQGIVGVNVPLGAFFVGVEGNAAKGFVGDIDWEYGVAGRAGIRAGESGLFYGKVGYQWVNFDRFGKDSRDYGATSYGLGVEVGPKDIGLGGVTGNGGVRFRFETSTWGGLKSFRPMAGAVLHF